MNAVLIILLKAVMIVLSILLVTALAIVVYCIFAMGSICSNKEDAEYAAYMAQKQKLNTGEY